MAEKYLVEPDVEFVNEIIGLGGDTLKKCFQCATCSVACPIAPENKPFPRKEMIAASWGLKDKLIGSADIWMCHHCGDCTALCPRGAKPGEVLGAIRSLAIKEYAKPKFLGEWINDPKQLGKLTAIPAALFAFLAMLTMLGHSFFADIFGGEFWYHTHDGKPVPGIAASNFVSSWFVDMVFVPLAMAVVVIFAMGLKRFIADIHKNALAEGKTTIVKIDPKGFLKSLANVLFVIGRHEKFTQCGENKERSTAHMMVLFSFIGLAVVTGLVFVGVYIFHQATPYTQINPIKWLGNLSGVVLVLGGILMLKNRLTKKDQTSSYKDWYIIALVLGLGVTGMLTEMSRLAGSAFFSYLFYYVHLIIIFHTFAYLPFSKMAHIVYRTVAMAYADYTGRK